MTNLKKMGKFVISNRKNGDFQFNLKAENGQTILASEGYSTKLACENGIASVKINSQDDSKYEKLESKNGQPYFILKAGNGQIIRTSEIYETIASRDNGIQSVMKNALYATIEEL